MPTSTLGIATLPFTPCSEERIEELADFIAEALGPDDNWTVTPLAQTIVIERPGAPWQWWLSAVEMDLASIIAAGEPSGAFHAAWTRLVARARKERRSPVLFTHHEGSWWMWTPIDVCDAPARVQIRVNAHAVHGMPVTTNTVSAFAWS